MSDKVKVEADSVEVKEVKDEKKKSGKGEHCGLFFGGLAAGIALLKLFEGRDGKNGLAHVVAAGIRVKDAALEGATGIQEYAGDVMATAENINSAREGKKEASSESTEA